MAFTDEEVEAIAHLARLGMGPEEIAHYRGDLERILALVQQFAEVETDEIEPMAHPQDLEQRLRVDAVTESDQHELFQSIAPNVSDDLYVHNYGRLVIVVVSIFEMVFAVRCALLFVQPPVGVIRR